MVSIDNIYWKVAPFESSDHVFNLMLDAVGPGENIRTYTSIGHYVQAAKACLFGGAYCAAFQKIMATTNTDEQQSLGRKEVADFQQAKWRKYKPYILHSAVEASQRRPHVRWLDFMQTLED